jgi:RNA polymerase sigma-70 factor, ECF subfamily
VATSQGSHDEQQLASDSEPVPYKELGPAELIARHQRGVWRYLRMLGCDDAVADDLTQETFLRVLRRDNFVQHSDAATSSYLRRTAYNLLVSDHRKRKRMKTVAESSLMDEVWDRWAGKDLAGDRAIEVLRDCFGSLTQRAQKALKMRFTSDASRVEIANELNISDHGARNLMQRAKGQLRECVEAKMNTPS